MASSPPNVPDHELLTVIGRGSYGEVWLARNVMDIYRAIKVVRSVDAQSKEPSQREFNGITKFEPVSRTHEALVDILQVGRIDADGSFFYIMELADDVERGQAVDPPSYRSRTLREVLRRRGRLPFGVCLEMALSITSGLHHLHQRGLVHRDVKPSNIIFVNGIPKLADIGLVSETADARSFVGTEGYIPPEGPGSVQADVFALGKVLYEASTGLDRMRYPEPRTGLDTDPERDDLRELNEIILKACAREPKRRYATAADAHHDLVILQGGRSVRRLRRLERAWARLRIPLVLACLLVVGSLAFQWIRLASVRAREAEQRRQLLIERARDARPRVSSEPSEGWRIAAMESLSQAAMIRADLAVRDEMAATLFGLDARVKFERHLPGLAIAFDAGGSQLLVDGTTNQTSLWELGTNRLHSLGSPGHGPFAFIAETRAVQLVSELDGSCSLWDIQEKVRLNRFHPEGASRCRLLTITPNAATASAVFDVNGVRRITVWKAMQGEKAFEIMQDANALALAEDGSLLAVGDGSGMVRVFSIPGGTEVASFTPSRLSISALELGRRSFTDIGGRTVHWMLAVADRGGRISIWDAMGGALQFRFAGSSADVATLAFSPDGTTLASAGRESVRLWDIATERLMLVKSGVDYAMDLTFSRDGMALAATSLGPHTRPMTLVLDLEPDAGIKTLRGLQAPIRKIAFSEDGHRVAAVAENWRAGVWNERGHLLRLIDVPQGTSSDNAGLMLNRNGTQLIFATGTEAGMWDVLSGRRIGAWVLPPGMSDCLAITPDSQVALFRVETRRGVGGPFAENPPSRDPRVCRIRELVRPNVVRRTVELPHFNWHVFDALAPADGRCFVAEGIQHDGKRTARYIRAFDAFTGRLLWSRENSPNGSWGSLSADPTSTILCAWVGGNPEGGWIDLRTGELLRRGNLGAPGRRGEWMAAQRSDLRGVTLYDQYGAREIMTMGADFEASRMVVFSPEGRDIAWGTRSGVVLVANIAEMNRRLSEFGLGW